ncbi:MAG: hypothetical protein HY866_11495, partial [Chloroflexi bacterium]|nr:hypothetical protein [Chloroflexota bacterium]
MKRIMLLVVILILIASGLPARAQTGGAQTGGEVKLRILNLSAEALSISVIPGTSSEQLAQIDFADPAPAISQYYPLSAEVNSLGVSITRQGGFSGGGFTQTFVAGHAYVLLVTDGEDGPERVVIDESGPMGSINSPALQGLARLTLIHTVLAESAAYRLQNSTGTYTLAQILAPDLSGFDPEPTISGFALSPGDYTLTIAAAVSGDII